MAGLKNNRNRWNDDLSRLPWDRFEHLLAAYYAEQGYRVEHVGTGASRTRFDGGIDLKLFKDGRYTIVQCKHWNAKQVPHNDVHQLIGLMVTEKADAGIFITSGEYTAAALQAAAKDGRIELVDGVQLRARLAGRIPTVPLANTIAWGQDESRPNGQSPQPGLRSPHRAKSRPGLLKGIFILLMPLLAFLLIAKFLPAFVGSILQRPQPVVAKPVAPARHQPSQPKVLVAPPAPRAEIGAAEQMMTPEELREWERKNAESMKILEQSTPELAD